jgi:excisionase family DNA binding protein
VAGNTWTIRGLNLLEGVMSPVVKDGAMRRSRDGRLTLSIDDAARVLSVSRDSSERHVMGEIRVVRVGRRLLIPMRELEAWVERTSASPLVGRVSSSRGARRRSGHRVAL